ncbi:MAG TPA: STAS domain-containing protein [Vicinamibacterales bacterium]|nr:STAS domain-containing protein [Vicinamibacterales bacterium]
MLRITWSGSGTVPGTAKVEGEIAGDHVRELERFAKEARRGRQRVALDLSDVTFVDSAGAVLLRRLRDQGFRFVEGSIFISSLVEDLPEEPGTGGTE